MPSKVQDSVTITRGSGNVFADLGIEDAEIKHMEMQLAVLVCETLLHRYHNHITMAAAINVHKTHISRMMTAYRVGKPQPKTSLLQLLKFARRLGYSVSINIEADDKAVQ